MDKTEEKLKVEVSITIEAPPDKIWKALTTPMLIKKYLMGASVTTTWKEGSLITYDGEYKGKTYHDKGVIKKVVPEKLLQSTYWSSMSGKEDKPENYNTVTYELFPKDFETRLTVTQDNIRDEKEQEHASANWRDVLIKLKEVAEGD
jgi:uncharacterized protein YndB with AHSA1/START domain